VCKTPTPGGPVPIPYPNIAMLPQASGGTLAGKVKIVGKRAATTKTEISMSSGDEPGTAGGGVVSNRFKGPAKFTKGSSKVKIEGSPAAHLTSIVGQNGVSNANMPMGAQVVPSQAKVLVMP
jgi:molybdopterin-binding protein